MTKKTVNYIYNKQELKNEMIKTIESIEKWCDSNNYRIKGDISNFKFEILRIDNLWDLSKRQMKSINKYMFYLKNQMTVPLLSKHNLSGFLQNTYIPQAYLHSFLRILHIPYKV